MPTLGLLGGSMKAYMAVPWSVWVFELAIVEGKPSAKKGYGPLP